MHSCRGMFSHEKDRIVIEHEENRFETQGKDVKEKCFIFENLKGWGRCWTECLKRHKMTLNMSSFFRAKLRALGLQLF